MITKILLVRHGKSVAQEGDIHIGTTDYHLCEEGYRQAEKLANRLKDIKIDEIYSSPLIRAKETVQPISEILDKKIKTEEDLKEIYMGKWENTPWTKLREKYPETVKKIEETEYYIDMEGQEETVDVAKRMVNVITKIAKDNSGKTIVIASHAVAIRTFLCAILNIPFKQTKSKIGDINNTSITFIDYDNITNKFKVLRTNDNSHNI